MAITKIEVNTEVLDNDIDSISDSLSVMQNSIQNMYEEIAELNTMWKGKANQAFNMQFNKDYSTMQEFLKLLDNYIDSLKNASNTYVRCENSVGDIVRSLKI